MKLKKFRIKNYKSIVDSGDCYLTDTVTIFAGKNESGKSSILEALEDFNTDREIREGAKPINSSGNPEISITFVVAEDTLKEIFKKVEIHKEPLPANIEVEIIKKIQEGILFVQKP